MADIKKDANKANKNKIRRKNINTVKVRNTLIVLLVLFLLACYIIYRVINLVKNPTDTFLVINGNLTQEEQATRIYNKR